MRKRWRVRVTKGTYFEREVYELLRTRWFTWAWIRAWLFVQWNPYGEAVVEQWVRSSR